MQMILVCTSCIGQIDYIPLRHYQYVTNVSDTYILTPRLHSYQVAQELYYQRQPNLTLKVVVSTYF